ncbi:MAG: amino acid permease [Gemmatimonadaceae bacterium]|nr:amino acid permease [Gemmatimonadaceae bacterium]
MTEADIVTHETDDAPRTLNRELGLLSATMIVVGGIIGGGIFFTPAQVARTLPTGEWVFAIWMIGGFVALAGALTFAELGAMLPDAGGPFVYIRRAFGERAAFVYGWMILTTIASGAAAAVALAFANYVGRFFDLAPVGGTTVVAVSVLLLLTATNYRGLRLGAAVQNTLVMSKLVALGALILGVVVLWNRIPAPLPVATTEKIPPLMTGLAAAFVPVLFSVGGWENLNMVAGEVRNPAKLIPRALALGIAIIMVCYLGVNVAYLHVLGRDGMAASSSVAADTAIRTVGSLGGTLITIAAMVSILGLVNVVLLATPRIFYAMSREGLFYPAAARIHPRFGTPHISIAMLGLWSVALLLLAQSRLDWLLNGEVFADWIFFGLSASSVFVFRRTMPDRPRPYRAWGYPVIPLFFVSASLVAVLSALVSAPIPSAFGAFSAIVGVVVYALFSRRWKASPISSAQ